MATNRDPYLDTLDRNRKRARELGWILGESEFDQAHADRVAAHAQHTAQPTAPKPTADSGSDADELVSASKSPGGHGWSQPAAMYTASATNRYPVQLEFSNEANIMCTALFDTGCHDNWISRRKVDSVGLHVGPLPAHLASQKLLDFSGTRCQATGFVKVTWILPKKTAHFRLLVAENLPIDILFGFELLLDQGFLRFPPDGFVGPLTMPEKSAEERGDEGGRRLSAAEKTAQIDRHIQWQDEMRREGWTWDHDRQQYFKRESGSSTKRWHPGGPTLDVSKLQRASH